MNMLTHLIAGWMFGFLGSLHCAGMCGPIALALPVPEGTKRVFVIGRVLYNSGRVVTYAALGVIAGFLGKYLALAGAQQMLSIVLGCCVIVAVLFPALQRRFALHVPMLGRVVSALSRAVARRITLSTTPGLFVLGLLNGLLPCGFVYLALAAAATTGETLNAVVFMAGFGGGTVPVMLAIGLMGKSIRLGLRNRLASALPVLGVVLGVLFVLRGLNLGIPYVSPHVAADDGKGAVHCHGE